MKWPFPSRTRVYVCDSFRPAEGWQVCTVRYDPWGDPIVKAGPFPFKDWVSLKANGTGGAGGYNKWKHKSGPPVDFTRKFSTEPPINK